MAGSGLGVGVPNGGVLRALKGFKGAPTSRRAKSIGTADDTTYNALLLCTWISDMISFSAFSTFPSGPTF